MFKPKTYLEFCQVMQLQTVVEINRNAVIVKAISIESGSGRSFNLTVQPVGNTTLGRSVEIGSPFSVCVHTE